MKKQGFSLLEVIVSIGLMGIFFFIVSEGFLKFKTFRKAGEDRAGSSLIEACNNYFCNQSWEETSKLIGHELVGVLDDKGILKLVTSKESFRGKDLESYFKLKITHEKPFKSSEKALFLLKVEVIFFERSGQKGRGNFTFFATKSR